MLGSVFGRPDFSRILIFGFSSFLDGKKCPDKSSRKIPGKSSKIYTQQESPTHFCRGAECQHNMWCFCPSQGMFVAAWAQYLKNSWLGITAAPSQHCRTCILWAQLIRRYPRIGWWPSHSNYPCLYLYHRGHNYYKKNSLQRKCFGTINSVKTTKE